MFYFSLKCYPEDIDKEALLSGTPMYMSPARAGILIPNRASLQVKTKSVLLSGQDGSLPGRLQGHSAAVCSPGVNTPPPGLQAVLTLSVRQC